MSDGKWGGQRTSGPGKRPGRPMVGNTRTVDRTVTLPADLIERLKVRGNGNVSANVRETSALLDLPGRLVEDRAARPEAHLDTDADLLDQVQPSLKRAGLLPEISIES